MTKKERIVLATMSMLGLDEKAKGAKWRRRIAFTSTGNRSEMRGKRVSLKLLSKRKWIRERYRKYRICDFPECWLCRNKTIVLPTLIGINASMRRCRQR
ncbi:MAG: hypothetical protein Q7R39_02405 [Dehalococcoidia bacterium]|nr:hypothetical protein [Dehalococcoidia bacterium]